MKRSALILSFVSAAFLSLIGLARQSAPPEASEVDSQTIDEEILFVG